MLTFMKGKSLSLICGALKWLVDSEKRQKERNEAILSGNAPPTATVTSGSHGIRTSSAVKATGNNPGQHVSFQLYIHAHHV